MLSGIFGKKSDHPMSDIKSAQTFLGTLPKNDAHKMLTELADWTESVADNAEFKPEHQFAVLCLLDETARPYVRKLSYEYFTPNDLGKFHENRLWLPLSNFFNQTSRAYWALFNRYCDGEKGAAALKPQEALLAARTAHTLSGQLKYACVHYEPIDGATWQNAARLWQHAEQNGYLNKPLTLYPGAPDSTTLEHELGHLFGWYSCGVGSLSPLHIHLNERITAQYRSSIKLGTTQDGCLFGFDLQQPSAPMQLKLADNTSPSMRFISMADMQPKLSELLKSLERNVVPEYLNLGGPYGAELVREAAQRLLDYLANPPSRRSPRRDIKASLNAVNGFAKLFGCVESGPNFAEGLPMQCRVEDISASGFRAVLPLQGSDGIRVGSLLGTKPDSVAHWGAAVVRRLRRDNRNQLHVGAETLASRITCVTLDQTGNLAGGDSQPALWLHARHGAPADEVQLLMKWNTFSMQRSLQTMLDGVNYLLLPCELQERGVDYDLAKFRTIRQETE